MATYKEEKVIVLVRYKADEDLLDQIHSALFNAEEYLVAIGAEVGIGNNIKEARAFMKESKEYRAYPKN